VSLLVVRLGDEERALATARVREVAKQGVITPVPRGPSWLQGLMQLRGQVVPMLRIGRSGLIRLPTVDPTTSGPVVIIEHGPLRAGFVVDEVIGVQDESRAPVLELEPILDGVRAEVLASARPRSAP
jgi:purine-binding chemotaxis protein CheW